MQITARPYPWTLESDRSDRADSCAVYMSQPASSLVVWRLEIWALTPEGPAYVDNVVVEPPQRAESASRCVALASIPGATGWRIVAHAIDLTVPSVNEPAELWVTTGPACGAPGVVRLSDSRVVDSAALVAAPSDIGISPDNFGVLKFTAPVLNRRDVVPNSWRGRWVVLRASGDDVHYAFSIRSGAFIDPAAAASDAGTSAQVSDIIPAGLYHETHRRIPQHRDPVFFCRRAAAVAAVVYMALSDRPE